MKNRKILFVTPPYHCGVVDVIGRWLPLNFVYLAGSARLAGFEAEIYDAAARNHGYPEIAQRFRTSAPSHVAVTAITATIDVAVKILDLAKSLNPQVVTILGGVHPSRCCEEVFAASAAVDYIICGEGEETLRELLQALENGGNPGDIPGLAFRQDNRIVKTAGREPVANIDALPMAWDLVAWQDYQYFVIAGSRLGVVSTSRGTDHDDTRRRFRDPCAVADEITHLYAIYDVKVFLLADGCPGSCRERWESFLDEMIERDLPVYLLMQASHATIVRDRDIMWKYRKAGVIHIYIDIEATDQAAFDGSGEGAVSEGKLALDIIREHGIISEASFVIGGPDESSGRIASIFRLARYYNPDNAQFLAFTPWPYDDTYAAVRQYVRVHDYAMFNLIDAVVEPKQMSLLQVDVAIVDCYRKFYMGKMAEFMTMTDEFKRGYLLRAMKLIMSSPFILKKLGIGTLNKVPAKIEELMRKDAR